MSVKRKKKKRKKAEDWTSYSGWDIYLYGGLDTEETAFYSSIEPELAAELLQSELDSMKEKRKRRGCKGRRSEMRRRDRRSNAPLTPQEEKLLDELSPPAERFEPGAWPDAQTRPMRRPRQRTGISSAKPVGTTAPTKSSPSEAALDRDLRHPSYFDHCFT